MSPKLRVALLGGLRIVNGDEPAALESPRLQALLAYLVLRSDAPQPRRHLAFLFWPDSAEEQSLTNLRQLLHQLRRMLPGADHVVATSRSTVHWRADAASCDVTEIQRMWDEADRARENGDIATAIAWLQQAAELYRGDLLPSCYDEWIEPERDALRRSHGAHLADLVELLESHRQYDEAAEFASRLLDLDPLREETHRSLIRLYGLAGEPALAARAYQRCEDVLEREVGISPSEETQELAARVQRTSVAAVGSVSPHPPYRGAHRESSTPAVLPLVGRHREWQWLLGAVKTGAVHRRAVLVQGEAGIGKSRLAEEFADWFSRQGIVCASGRCFAAEGLLPFGPVAQWLRSEPILSGIGGLEETWRRELSRLLPELLAPEALPPEEGVGSARRLRLFEALARAVLASEGPTVLVLDDLQWCDSETLAWLHYLLRLPGAGRLLLLATLRLGEPDPDARVASWLLQLESEDLLVRLGLGPLDPDETRSLASAVVEREIDHVEARSLFLETEGNPLFIVETMRARRAAPGADLALPASAEEPLRPPAMDGEIPARVRAVIRSRLSQLSREARALVSYAATIGREVPLPVLRHAARDEVEVVVALDELCQRVLLKERGTGSYDFSHDRIREVAYLELSSARRALLHFQVARALESLYPGDADLAGEIARHLDRADRPDEAVSYFRTAADRALTLFASHEAASHLERALELVSRRPDSRDRTELELELHTALGVPLVARFHYSDPRVWETYRQARELSDRLGRPTSPPILRALALANLMRSQLLETLRLGRELASAARGSTDPILQVEADYVLGVALYWRGRIPAARRHLERAIARYDRTRAPEHLRSYAQDPAIVCNVRLALAEWQAGLAETAHARYTTWLQRAKELRHPFTLAYARHFGCFVLVECGDRAGAREQVAALLRESEEHGLANWPLTASAFQGWLRVDAGDETGVEAIRKAIDDYVGGGFTLGLPYYRGLVGRALLRQGSFEAALREVDAGLAFAARTGERFWDAELLRLRGQLLDRLGGDPPETTACYREALRVARRQGSRALEDRVLQAMQESSTPASVARLGSVAR